MATTTTNFGWDIPQSTDLVKDGATAIAALGQDIDTALVDLKGGTTGQVLSKASGTDLDFTWVAQDDSNAIQNAIVDAKGDLITATAADTPARLGVGTNGHVLTADSTTATGLKWAAVAAGGKVLQVVNATTATTVSITSQTWTDSTLSATITPSATSSKILVIVTQPVQVGRNGADSAGSIRLVRGSTAILTQDNEFELYIAGATGSANRVSAAIAYLDSPATTSATTYKTQGLTNLPSSGGYFAFQGAGGTGSIVLMEIGA